MQQKIQPKFFDEKPDFRDKTLYTDLIAEFKRSPRAKRPYVLLGCICKEMSDLSNPRYTPSIHAMYACSPGGLAGDLQRYLHRMIILDYYFPDENKIPKGETASNGLLLKSGWYADYASDDGRKRRQDLMDVIHRAMGEAGAMWDMKQKVAGLADENAGLLAKLKEAQDRLAEKKGKQANG